MNNQAIRYLACICCGARWWEFESAPPNSGCFWCGSSVVALERNLSAETAEIIKKHGDIEGKPDVNQF